MNRLAFIPLLLSAALVFGQEAADPAKTAPPTEPPKPAEALEAPVGLYQLKSKSSFVVPEGTRTPFVPIGWVRRDGPKAAVAKLDLDASSFVFTSVLLGNPSLAVINGRSYAEGDAVRLPRTGPQARVIVQRISDGKVVLKIEDKEVTIPLKRGELNEKKIEETLLNEDRDPVLPGTKPR